jgi:helix-turn-helix, Psq domain
MRTSDANNDSLVINQADAKRKYFCKAQKRPDWSQLRCLENTSENNANDGAEGLRARNPRKGIPSGLTALLHPISSQIKLVSDPKSQTDAWVKALSTRGGKRDGWGSETRKLTPCYHSCRSPNNSTNNTIMPRRKDPESYAKEARIQAALVGIANGQYPSVNHAARECGVPPSTLHHRLNGRQSRVESHEE